MKAILCVCFLPISFLLRVARAPSISGISPSNHPSFQLLPPIFFFPESQLCSLCMSTPQYGAVSERFLVLSIFFGNDFISSTAV